jgi:tRNA pseudouridine32 synthase/23S rRNA pseudouridine746 synthase
MKDQSQCFIPLPDTANKIALPERFTFPFYYLPHPLSELAAKDLQQRIKQLQINHNFGLQEGQEGMVIGKMFGVLVVKTQDGTLGYLSSFSGKLANENHHAGFVPPVFDMLKKDGFFRKEEMHLNAINAEIDQLESSSALAEAETQWEAMEAESEKALVAHRQLIKTGKAHRKAIRQEAAKTKSEQELAELEQELVKQSLDHQYQFKRLTKHWREQLAESAYNQITDQISKLKAERKQRSAALQKQLFDQYLFLNARGEHQSLLDIFSPENGLAPPAGAGECAAPKLLHYAFIHGLKPVAMAEFWWGASPKSEVRKHAQFYPACRGKCEPILGHMLQGLDVDPNPLLDDPGIGKTLEIVFEDEHLLAVNKPAEFLSVPGKTILDSVQARVKAWYPDASGPLIVHRLDMSTSGLLLIAKSKDVHKRLQQQFLRRTVKKRNVALLDGELDQTSGEIELPLRVDFHDRPRQLVCYEYGKSAKTLWQIIKAKDGKTLVHFFPITGRTHQLRVHAAHHLGLNTPIVGDDLYGSISDRLHLHAEQIEFVHPVTREAMILRVEAPFDLS